MPENAKTAKVAVETWDSTPLETVKKTKKPVSALSKDEVETRWKNMRRQLGKPDLQWGVDKVKPLLARAQELGVTVSLPKEYL